MGQPVKISDTLLLEARLTSEVMHRSIAGQIEHWAQLGRIVDRMMNGERLIALRRSGTALSLSHIIKTVNAPEGRQRLANYLESKPFPRFVAHPDSARLYIREDADGTRTAGRMVGREFVPLEAKAEEQSSTPHINAA